MDAVNEEVSPEGASDEEEMVTSETEEKAGKEAVKAESESDDDDDDDEDANEAEVKSLETSLSTNPYSSISNHEALIKKLHTMGELDRLRAARNNMSNIFPLSPESWLLWIRDEIKLATTDEQKAEVMELCERALKDYVCKFFLGCFDS